MSINILSNDNALKFLQNPSCNKIWSKSLDVAGSFIYASVWSTDNGLKSSLVLFKQNVHNTSGSSSLLNLISGESIKSPSSHKSNIFPSKSLLSSLQLSGSGEKSHLSNNWPLLRSPNKNTPCILSASLIIPF